MKAPFWRRYMEQALKKKRRGYGLRQGTAAV
jgi:hypothetical protein